MLLRRQFQKNSLASWGTESYSSWEKACLSFPFLEGWLFWQESDRDKTSFNPRGLDSLLGMIHNLRRKEQKEWSNQNSPEEDLHVLGLDVHSPSYTATRMHTRMHVVFSSQWFSGVLSDFGQVILQWWLGGKKEKWRMEREVEQCHQEEHRNHGSIRPTLSKGNDHIREFLQLPPPWFQMAWSLS